VSAWEGVFPSSVPDDEIAMPPPERGANGMPYRRGTPGFFPAAVPGAMAWAALVAQARADTAQCGCARARPSPEA